MSLTKTIPVGTLTVTARELSVTEIRAWYAKLTQPSESADVVDVLLFRDLSVSEICEMSDLTPEALASLAPSDIDQVITAIKEVNPRFFEMRARLEVLGQQVQQQSSTPPASLSETSVP